MKKLLALILAAMMLLSMAACGSMAQPADDGEEEDAVTEQTDAEENEETEEAEETEETEPADTQDAEDKTADVGAGETQPAAEAQTNAEPQQTTASQPAAVSADKTTASGYVGSDVSALYAAIGRPASSDYAPSCLGDGEDGNLYYDGFTVYTYRENGSETVQYVE